LLVAIISPITAFAFATEAASVIAGSPASAAAVLFTS
jgi:hypothetical protein